MAYEIVELEIGRIGKTEIVPSVYMDRERFLEIVDSELEYYDNADLTLAIRPIAETMPRFPMGTWINETRGCGCIIGEYLVAKSQVDRVDFINSMRPDDSGDVSTWPSVHDMIKDDPLSSELLSFGNDIDERLRMEIKDSDIKNIEIKETSNA